MWHAISTNVNRSHVQAKGLLSLPFAQHGRRGGHHSQRLSTQANTELEAGPCLHGEHPFWFRENMESTVDEDMVLPQDGDTFQGLVGMDLLWLVVDIPLLWLLNLVSFLILRQASLSRGGWNLSKLTDMLDVSFTNMFCKTLSFWLRDAGCIHGSGKLWHLNKKRAHTHHRPHCGFKFWQGTLCTPASVCLSCLESRQSGLKCHVF